jgi:superfamily I DNA/RNA helicase
VQIRLAALLQAGRGQLTVVGDDAQSVYGFHGATNKAFATLSQALDTFAARRGGGAGGDAVQTLPLQLNYCSMPAVLEACFQFCFCLVACCLPGAGCAAKMYRSCAAMAG